MAVVTLPVLWREKLGVTSAVEIDATTLRDVLAAVDARTGQGGLLAPDGDLSPFVSVFVDGAPVVSRDALAQELAAGSAVRVVSALAGG